MTKRRASIRGRGAEILFGEPPDDAIEPRVPGRIDEPETDEPPVETRPEAAAAAPAAMESTSPRFSSATPQGDEIEHALRAEALDGAPRTLRHSEATMLDVAVPVTPEMEVAFLEEEYDNAPPPEPAAEAGFPSSLEHTPDDTDEEDVAMYGMPPTSVDSVASGVVPPRPERGWFRFEDPEVVSARDIQEPEKPANILVLPERPLTPEERAEIMERLGEEWMAGLEAEIDAAYDRVRKTVGENEAVTVDAYNWLLKARDILVLRKVDQLAQAEYYLELVQARLKRVSASELAAKKYQWRILGWGLAWGIAFLAGLVMLGQEWFQSIVFPTGTANSLIELDIFVAAMLWGGVGGAVAVLYSLFKHVGRRDFDSQFLISYVGKPFLGLISGAIIYMAFNLVIALGIFLAGVETDGGNVIPVVAPGVVYLVALAAGFQEARLLALIDRLWDQIFRGQTEENAPDGAVSPG